MAYTIPALGYYTLLQNIAEAGYEPKGILSINQDGADNVDVVINKFYIYEASPTISITYKNTVNSERRLTYIYAAILYEKA